MAPAREVVDPLRAKLVCADLLGESRNQHGFSGKMGTQDPLEQSTFQTLHSLHLMNEERL
jgi:hypothetical protein